jgi:hypothetical protein
MGFSKFVTKDNNVVPDAAGVRRGDLVVDREEQRFYLFKVNAVLDMRNQKNWEVSYLPGGTGVFLLTDRSDADYWLSSFSESLELLDVPNSVASLATSDAVLRRA